MFNAMPTVFDFRVAKRLLFGHMLRLESHSEYLCELLFESVKWQIKFVAIGRMINYCPLGCSGNVDATAGCSASSPKAGAVGISRYGSIFNGKQNRIMITT